MAEIPERTNEEWLKDLRPDQPNQAEALAELRQRLKYGLLAYLHSRSDLNSLANRELEQMSEDFAQEALLKIQANLDTFQGRSKFTTWAAKIAANTAITELRRSRWRDLSLDKLTAAGTTLQEILDVEPSQLGNPDVENERRQVWQAIREVIQEDLTERQRQALLAVQVDHVPITEVARLLGTNANNVYKLLHDARLKLKRRLQALGLETDYILQLFS